MLHLLSIINCTIYFINKEPIENYKIDPNTKTIIINTNKKINIKYPAINKDKTEVKKEILSLDIDQYKKLHFCKQFNSQFLNDPCVIVILDYDSKIVFTEPDDLILNGCNNYYKLGSFYFCRCEYEKCGLFCESDKAHGMINFFLILFLVCLFVNLKKKKEKMSRILEAKNEKRKNR